jgi:hypothetical protein
MANEKLMIEPIYLEVIQDVIDRFLYLHERERDEYIDSIMALHKQERYAIDCEVVEGTRRYKTLIK